MKYKISSDRVIIDHIATAGAGGAEVHAHVNDTFFKRSVGVVTSCDTKRRVLTLQLPDGGKQSFGFDVISVPDQTGLTEGDEKKQ